MTAATYSRLPDVDAVSQSGGRRDALYPGVPAQIFRKAFSSVGQQRADPYYTGEDGDYCGIDFSATMRPLTDIPGKTLGIYNDIVGLSTAAVIFTGAGALADAHARRVRAQKRGDRAKVIDERINEVGMAGLTAAGAAFITYRPMAIAAQLHGQAISPDSTQTFGRAAYGAGQAGNVAFGVFYAVNAKNALTAIFKEMYFRFKLWKDGAAFLREQLKPVIVQDDPEAFRKKALEDGDEWLERVFKEMKEAGLLPKDFSASKEDRKRIFSQMMGSDARLVALGKEIMQRNAEESNEARLQNLVGKKCLKVLRSNAPIEDKIARIHQKFNLMHTLKAIGKFLLAATGLLWVIYSFINNPVTNVSFGVQSGCGFLIDVKKFIKWCKNGVVGKWDKIITIGCMLLLAASIAAMIIFPPLMAIPLGLAIAMFITQGVWFVFSAIKLYFILKKERENPTLEGLAALIKTHPPQSKVDEVFNKLAEKERRDVLRACDEVCQQQHRRPLGRKPEMYELLSGIEHLLKKRHAQQVAILTSLRDAILPHIQPRAYALS